MFTKILDGSKKLADKSKNMVEIMKIKSTIDKTETEIMKRKTELGALTYRLYCEADGKIDEPDIVRMCSVIQSMFSEIDLLKAQIASIEVRGQCPSCSFQNDADMRFCARCGTDLSIVNNKPEMGSKRCSKCSFLNTETDAFCGKCGTPLA